jgi:hypothetical protein
LTKYYSNTSLRWTRSNWSTATGNTTLFINCKQETRRWLPLLS